MRTLLLLTMLGMGTLTYSAKAEEPGAPVCQTTQDDQGAVLNCNNLTDDQANALFQDPEARRICYRECSFRIFRMCLGWHVVCRHCHGWRCHGWR